MIPRLESRGCLALLPQPRVPRRRGSQETGISFVALQQLKIYTSFRPAECTYSARGPRLRAALPKVLATSCHHFPSPDSSDTAACRSIWGTGLRVAVYCVYHRTFFV